MSLRDRVQTDITTAMRAGDALRRDVLRMASNAAYNLEKANRRPLTDDEYLARPDARGEDAPRVRRGVPQRAAARTSPRRRRRRSTSSAEYLPDRPSPRPRSRARRRGDRGDRRDGARDLGKVMGWLSPRTRGRADGKVVSGLVAQALARPDAGARWATTQAAYRHADAARHQPSPGSPAATPRACRRRGEPGRRHHRDPRRSTSCPERSEYQVGQVAASDIVAPQAVLREQSLTERGARRGPGGVTPVRLHDRAGDRDRR